MIENCKLSRLIICGVAAGLVAAPACSESDDSGSGDGDSANATGGASTGGSTDTGGDGSGGDGSGGDPGSGGDTGPGGAGTGGEDGMELPELLSETGLYSDIEQGTLEDGVMEFQPRYVLWSDTASKNRWVSIPAGTQIDTSDMDKWVFPVGTKLWKDFTRDGVRVETRLLMRTREGGRGWQGVAYIWNDEQTEAVAAPDGMENASGTDHDVPASGACQECHGEAPDWPLGFSALQLSHDLGGVTLADLESDGWLTDAPASEGYAPPGTGNTQDALGYIHANCGGCHREGSTGDFRTQLRLWLTVDRLGTVEETDIYQYLINEPSQAGTSDLEYRIYGGDPEQSELIRRMRLREEGQMPPLGTEDTDDAALTIIEDWIETYSPPAAGGAGP